MSNDDTNNSVIYGGKDIPYFCAGVAATYDPVISDPDGDSLVISLAGAKGAGNPPSNVTYSSGSGTTPITGMTVDSETGVLSFTTPATGGNYTVVYNVKEYDPVTGVLVGESTKEIAFFVDGSCANTTPTAGASLTGLTGSAVLNSNYSVTINTASASCFTLSYTDLDGIDEYFSNATTALPGATFNTTNGQVCWTPNVGDSGTYYITIGATDEGCSIPASTSTQIEVIVQNNTPPLTIDSVTVTNESCQGDDDGQIEIHASGGIGPFVYEISFNQPPIVTFSQNGNSVFTGLSDNNYVVRVIDQGDGNNTVQTSATVLGGPTLAIVSVSSSVNACFGDSNGVATVNTFTFGSPTFLWSSGETTATADSLPGGMNYITVTENLCVRNDSVLVGENAQIVITIDSIHELLVMEMRMVIFLLPLLAVQEFLQDILGVMAPLLKT